MDSLGDDRIIDDLMQQMIHRDLKLEQVWKRTGEIGLLPRDARLRLQKAAATPNPRERLIAMSEADAWVKSTYPEYFHNQPKE